MFIHLIALNYVVTLCANKTRSKNRIKKRKWLLQHCRRCSQKNMLFWWLFDGFHPSVNGQDYLRRLMGTIKGCIAAIYPLTVPISLTHNTHQAHNNNGKFPNVLFALPWYPEFIKRAMHRRGVGLIIWNRGKSADDSWSNWHESTHICVLLLLLFGYLKP